MNYNIGTFSRESRKHNLSSSTNAEFNLKDLLSENLQLKKPKLSEYCFNNRNHNKYEALGTGYELEFANPKQVQKIKILENFANEVLAPQEDSIPTEIAKAFEEDFWEILD